MLSTAVWSKVQQDQGFPFRVMQHQSMLLRPLKNVDMVLQHNKVKNLELAIASLNNMVIRPGECFSIWKNVGRPTASKGYLDGLVLSNGQIGKGVGGGLCQLGNLLYWMVLHSPLTVKERWRHSYDVFPDVNRLIPFGCGATLSYNYVDFQFVNDTSYTFQLHLSLSSSHLVGSLTCNSPLPCTYVVEERNHRIVHQFWGGYTRHNEIWQLASYPDGQQKETLVTENHAVMMYNPLLPA